MKIRKQYVKVHINGKPIVRHLFECPVSLYELSSCQINHPSKLAWSFQGMVADSSPTARMCTGPSKLARFRLSIEVDSALPATCEGCSTLSLRSLRRWRDAVLEDPVGRKPGMDQVCEAKQLQRAAVLPLA